MQLIAAVDENWGLGQEGKLLFSIPEDLHRFKALTTGGTVIMGRKTLDSLPGGKPLPHRLNLVLTRNRDFSREGVAVCHSPEELPLCLPQPVTVMGGGEIYRLLLERCRLIYLTKIHAARPADVFFPNLDRLPQWRLTQQSPPHHWEGLTYTFCVYERRNHP